MKSHFWDLTESATTARSLDIGETNVQKRRIGTPEDETTTAIETFPEEEEEETMAETRILNLKPTVTTEENRDMPKQPVGCFRAMRAKDPHGLNREKTVQKPEQLPLRQVTRLNTCSWQWNFRPIKNPR
jgi:hypothetical protein